MPDQDVRRPEALAILPDGYHELFDRAVEVFLADERVRALWVHGSLARGDADASSDLDLMIAVRDDVFDELWDGWPEWLARITPTVLAKPIPWGRGIIYTMTPECLRLDVVAERAGAVATSGFHERDVVFDRDGLNEQIPPAPPPAGPDLGKITTAVEESLRYLGMLPEMLGRGEGEHHLIQLGYTHIRQRIGELFLEANAPLPVTGVKRWREKLTDDQFALIASLPWPQAERDELIAAHAVIGARLVEVGRSVTAQVGVEWPQPLEDAVRAHLRSRLGIELTA